MTWKTRTGTLSAIASLAVLGLGSTPAQAAPGMEIAIEDEDTFVQRFYGENTTPYYDRLAQLGVSAMRISIQWASLLPPSQARARRAPSSPKYDFSRVDAAIADATARGITVQLTLTGPVPAWASGNGRVGITRPNAKRFGRFARTAAAHFRGRVTRFSVWNEPNYIAWISPQREAGLIYRELYKAAYRGIKGGAGSAAEVWIGETVPYDHGSNGLAPLDFLRQMACVDKNYRRLRGKERDRRCRGSLRANGYAHHPYDFARPPSASYPGRDNATLGTLKNLTKALDRLARARALGPARMPLYLTEYGYFASGKRSKPESARAEYLPQAFSIAQENPRVKQMLQYLLVQDEGNPFNTGLITQDGFPEQPFFTLAKWGQDAIASGHAKAPG